MRTSNVAWTLGISLLLTLSVNTSADDKRYLNINHATHISAGWIAYNNGELYQCHFSQTDKSDSPSCIQAKGLPSLMQTVDLLWAEGNEAWVSYTNGIVYGCHSKALKAPVCTQASGLP